MFLSTSPTTTTLFKGNYVVNMTQDYLHVTCKVQYPMKLKIKEAIWFDKEFISWFDAETKFNSIILGLLITGWKPQ